jgi:hypothetical protein
VYTSHTLLKPLATGPKPLAFSLRPLTSVIQPRTPNLSPPAQGIQTCALIGPLLLIINNHQQSLNVEVSIDFKDLPEAHSSNSFFRACLLDIQ